MSREEEILDIFIKSQVQSDVFQHKKGGLLEAISLAEVHCIDCIGTIVQPNVTKISKTMGLTRGGISKISKKLLGKGLIESYRSPDNNKEIYFRLTESGHSLYVEHQKIHHEVRVKWTTLLTHYNDDELAVILRFITDVTKETEGMP
jgi:DNA-binding MarR family transcriptional regulator